MAEKTLAEIIYDGICNGPCYGDYIAVPEEDIDNAKPLLLKQMIGAIEELAKRDDFWIVVSAEVYKRAGFDIKENYATVAWKICLPQIGQEVNVCGN